MPEKIISSETLDDYISYVYDMCIYMAELQKFSDKLKKGEQFKRSLFVYACEMVCLSKEKLIQLKKELGFDDAFAFLEDNSFIGFSIKDGRLLREEGVTDEDIFSICDKWYYGFPATANHYQFEVANYVIALAETDKYGEYKRYPDSLCKQLGIVKD